MAKGGKFSGGKTPSAGKGRAEPWEDRGLRVTPSPFPLWTPGVQTVIFSPWSQWAGPNAGQMAPPGLLTPQLPLGPGRWRPGPWFSPPMQEGLGTLETTEDKSVTACENGRTCS